MTDQRERWAEIAGYLCDQAEKEYGMTEKELREETAAASEILTDVAFGIACKRIAELGADLDKLKRRETDLAEALKQCRTRRDQIMRGRAAIRREVLLEAATFFDDFAPYFPRGIPAELRRMAEEEMSV